MSPRSSSVASVASTGSFQSVCKSQGGALFGSVLWIGEGDSHAVMNHGGQLYVRDVVRCNHENFLQKYNETEWVVAVVFADQPLTTIMELSVQARRHVYNMGVAVPVYAATLENPDAAFTWCDVVAGLSQWQTLAETLFFKLAARPPKTTVIWCDPAASNPTMHVMAGALANLGLNLEFYTDPEQFTRAASEDVAAVVTSKRGIPCLRTIREKLHEDRARPLYWVVSLRATADSAYANGADGAIVCDNVDLRLHKDHLMSVNPGQPWMWQVVIGDLLSIIQAVGVSGMGGIQWSMPKLYDDLEWRRRNFQVLYNRSAKVFHQLAEVATLTVSAIEPNMNMDRHEARFQEAKKSMRGYVRDRILYHGTSEEVARKICDANFIASKSGMYGPGVYSVDPTGLKKAAFFAMSAANRRAPDDRSSRTQRSRGAIVAFRGALCDTRIVTELNGPSGGWYNKSTPLTDGQDSVIGVCKTGYWQEELSDTAEYVLCSPDHCVPLGIAIFEGQ